MFSVFPHKIASFRMLRLSTKRFFVLWASMLDSKNSCCWICWCIHLFLPSDSARGNCGLSAIETQKCSCIISFRDLHLLNLLLLMGTLKFVTLFSDISKTCPTTRTMAARDSLDQSGALKPDHMPPIHFFQNEVESDKMTPILPAFVGHVVADPEILDSSDIAETKIFLELRTLTHWVQQIFLICSFSAFWCSLSVSKSKECLRAQTETGLSKAFPFKCLLNLVSNSTTALRNFLPAPSACFLLQSFSSSARSACTVEAYREDTPMFACLQSKECHGVVLICRCSKCWFLYS